MNPKYYDQYQPAIPDYDWQDYDEYDYEDNYDLDDEYPYFEEDDE